MGGQGRRHWGDKCCDEPLARTVKKVNSKKALKLAWMMSWHLGSRAMQGAGPCREQGHVGSRGQLGYGRAARMQALRAYGARAKLLV